MTSRQTITGRIDLKFPLHILSLDVKAGSDVAKFQPVFTFSFLGTAVESQDDGSDKVVPRKYIETFESPLEGTDCQWFVRAGDVVNNHTTPLLAVSEPCAHEVQWGGLCAACGKDMTESDYLTAKATSRATVAMSHDALGLTVSMHEASRIEQESSRRLVQATKLSLVVDLDQCVIQTTVDPTVGDWLQDRTNPNHSVLQDVASFRIAEEGPLAPVYFVKPRPGLRQFLEAVSTRYEMHIYTMGTRPYARQIASVIDPEGKFFAGRILSRDESGSSTHKSLRRLFPVDDSMVVIIDDRADVWSWCPNLVKVYPFDFFVGIGDINGSFLPSIDEGQKSASTKTSATATRKAQEGPDATTTAIETEESDLAARIDRQAAQIDEQVDARPLAAQQKELEIAEQSKDSTETKSSLLREDDDQLVHLERILKAIHRQFYQAYDANIEASSRVKRLADVRADHRRAAKRSIPADVKDIIPEMKQQVLRGVRILFSGLFRSDKDPRAEWQGELAAQYGARVLDGRSDETPTHIIVGPTINVSNLTDKARMVHRKPWIKLVYVEWLLQSTSRCERLAYAPFKVDQSLPDVEPPSTTSSPPTGPASDSGNVSLPQSELDVEGLFESVDWQDLEGEIGDYVGNVSDSTATEASFVPDAAAPGDRSVPSSPRGSKRQRNGDPAPSASSPVTTSTSKPDGSQLSKRRLLAKNRPPSRLASSFSRDMLDGGGSAGNAGVDVATDHDSPVAGADRVSTDPAGSAEGPTSASSPAGTSDSDMSEFAEQLELDLAEA